MKRLKISSVFLLALLACFTVQAQNIFLSSVAPQGSSYLKTEKSITTLHFTNQAGTNTLALETNLAINASCDQSWCTPRVEGKSLIVTVAAYNGSNPRTAKVKLTAKDNHKITIDIAQIGSAAAIICREQSIVFIDDQRTVELEVTANTPFTFELPEWISVKTRTPVVGKQTYTLEATALTEERTERTGNVVIKPTSGSIANVTVPVRQVFNGYPRFAVISDIHFGNNEGEGPMVKVPKALKNLLKKEPRLDAIFIAGDLTDSGQASQYDLLLSVFNDPKVVPADFPIYFMMGNHDNYSDEQAQPNYFKIGQPLHQYIDIKGYPFITVSMSGTNSNGYDASCLNYLSEKLADASVKYPGKPIFVFTHVPPLNTMYGSRDQDGGWGTAKFDQILRAYPQVVIFTGHSHFPLGDPRSIHQKYYTSINDGSTTYSEVEPGVVSEGIHPDKYDYVTESVIVNVDAQSNVEVERWDTYNDEEMLPRWNIQAPHDGTKFVYTESRTGGSAPTFGNVPPTVTDVQEERCVVTFPQATDDEVVHHYIVEIVSDEVVCSNRIFSGYYLNSRKPLSLTVRFSGVPTGATLKARVTAVDSYNNKSNPIESAPFSTEEYVPEPGSKAPKADLFDLKFESNGNVNDQSGRNKAIVKGSSAPAVTYNETYGLYGASFPGSSSTFYKVDYQNDTQIKNAFSNEFTYEVLYKPNDTDNVCLMSAQESGGAGIEQSGSGLLQFYAHVGGSYKTLNSSVTVEAGKFYHVLATYSKTTGKTKIYVNGSPAGEMEASGSFGFPSNTAAHWICIGGDASTGTNAQYALDGDILVARMYSKAVSRDEVYWLYKELKDRSENYQPNPGTSAPAADLFDVQFEEDGSATDLSVRKRTVSKGSTTPTTEMNSTYNRRSAKFNGTNKCFYRVDYASDTEIKSAFNNGFAFEMLYRTEETNNICPMSAQESGGTGIEQADGGKLQLYAHIGGSYKILNSSVTVQANKFYHVIATYDKTAGKLRMYVNGEPAGEIEAKGDFKFPSDTNAQWICIGGDANTSGNAQFSLKGEIVIARMYGKTLSRDDVYWLHKGIVKE